MEKKIKIYQVKQGYNLIASFENIDQATKFFSDCVRVGARNLLSVASKTDSTKKVHYWGSDVEFTMRVLDVTIYPTKKDAEFAVFEQGKGSDEEAF